MIVAEGDNGTIELDGEFITIRLLSATLIRWSVNRIPVRQIQAIRYSRAREVPPQQGYISFTLARNVAKTSWLNRQMSQVAKDENAVVIVTGQAEGFNSLVEAIELVRRVERVTRAGPEVSDDLWDCHDVAAFLGLKVTSVKLVAGAPPRQAGRDCDRLAVRDEEPVRACGSAGGEGRRPWLRLPVRSAAEGIVIGPVQLGRSERAFT